MTVLPHNLYRADQVRELDRYVIEKFRISGNILMERAGAAAFAVLRERWPKAKRIAVLCGIGNNGGDGFVIARLAREVGLEVQVLQIGDTSRQRGDALAAAQRLEGAGVTAEAFAKQSLQGFDVLVDGLLGTGLQGEVRDPYCMAIEAINASGRPVLALDIPSGLDADTGRILGCSVSADLTISFIGLKQGVFTGDGPDHVGELRFDDLSVPTEVYDLRPAAALRLAFSDFKSRLVPRRRNSHKGDYGHVLIIGGDSGYTGAVRMAGEAAARVGAGLVSIASRASHAVQLNAMRPELMCHGVEDQSCFNTLAERANVIAIGPGLGQSEWAESLLSYALETGLPLVVDADALNLVAQQSQHAAHWILTPHVGEAARMLGKSTAEIEADRFAAVSELADQYGGVVVLKGAGTLVKLGRQATGVCQEGNPGMASGGMGDVLTGVIAGLLAQGLSAIDAARLGVCLHAAAGDAAARGAGERGMLASDLMSWVRRLANPQD